MIGIFLTGPSHVVLANKCVVSAHPTMQNHYHPADSIAQCREGDRRKKGTWERAIDVITVLTKFHFEKVTHCGKENPLKKQ